MGSHLRSLRAFSRSPEFKQRGDLSIPLRSPLCVTEHCCTDLDMARFARIRIPAILPEQWEEVQRLLSEPHESFEAPRLCGLTGMSLEAAHSLMIGLCQEGFAALQMLVFHDCSESPVKQHPYEQGFQPVPWECCECGFPVTNSNELSYDIRAVVREPVEFV